VKTIEVVKIVFCTYFEIRLKRKTTVRKILRRII